MIMYIAKRLLSIFTWITNTSNEHVQNQTLHLSSLSLNRTCCLSKPSKWNSAKLCNGLPASALVSPPPTPSFPSILNTAARGILKCRSAHKYFSAQTSNDFPSQNKNQTYKCLECDARYVLLLAPRQPPPGMLLSFGFLHLLCFGLESSSSRNLHGPFSASFRSLHLSNIIFSRRSPITNIFQNYTIQSPTPIPYPSSALFFSIALTYYLTYLLVYCLSLCHLPHLQVPGGKGLSLVHYCILSF